MKISGFNQRLTIQQKEIQVDMIGNRIEQWQDYYRCFCKVDSQVVHESENATRIVDDGKIAFILRWCNQLSQINTQSYRVLFLDGVYNIVGIDYMNFKNKIIKLHCQRSKS